MYKSERSLKNVVICWNFFKNPPQDGNVRKTINAREHYGRYQGIEKANVRLM